MIDKVLIYEVHYSNFNRYVIPLAEYLVTKGVADQVIMVYDSFTAHDKIKDLADERIQLAEVRTQYEALKGKDNSNTVFFNYSYRITDLYWTYRSKKIGIHTYQLQHGMYAEFLERSFLGYFSAMSRKMVYLKYMVSFLLKGKGAIFLYLLNKDFMKSFKVNAYLENHKKYALTEVQSDHVFVWGDYWKEWFMINHYYPSMASFTTVGNPDYHTFIKNKKAERNQNQVCYIAQTFVEDGRMEKADYKAVIDQLADAFEERLVVKLHPRSDKTIFEKVVGNGGGITYDFPISGFYVGHYSSLLALAANENSKVFLLEINNEEIPEYFKNSADGVFTTMAALVSAVMQKNTSSASKEISYYFENKEEHPFQIISERITGLI
ncbi:hypothetical protein ACFQZJ_00160 [Maribacter chungangensis]|uniref:Uncharacterized protein n=1 Tax=Maribacter chungangensis TaxID=1069117 RepID=A0ABW3AYA0_9FLAO